jgi:hypothetical protein
LKFKSKIVYISEDVKLDFAILKVTTKYVEGLPKPLKLHCKKLKENDTVYGTRPELGNYLNRFDGVIGIDFSFTRRYENQIIPGDSGAPVLLNKIRQSYWIKLSKGIYEY